MSKRSGRKSQGANDFLMPYAPTITSVSDVGTGRAYNNGAVDVSFTADPRNAATSYTIISEPGNYDVTGSSSPLRVRVCFFTPVVKIKANQIYSITQLIG